MSPDRAPQQTVLIVSDVATEAGLVQSLLEGSVDKAELAIEAEVTPEFFQRSQASVLVLAYRDLQKGARFYAGLYRRGTTLKTPVHPHRTIALCDRKDVRAAHELCSSGQINDYVQFWPTTWDAPRLLMSVHSALQHCTDQWSACQSAVALAAQAERMAQLEELLLHYMNAGAGHLASAGQSLANAEAGIGTAIVGLSTEMLSGKNVQLRPGRAPADLTRELSKFSRNSILPRLRDVSGTLAPLNDWVDKMEGAVAPHIQDTRVQLERAMRAAPTVLIVDDDQFQRQMVGRIVESAGYRALCASCGGEALDVIRKTPPDLILMDVMMPDMSGLEVVQRLKVDPAFAKIPVIMVTGKSERVVVLESVKLGVSDFVVKPLERKMLLDKISRLLDTSAPAPGQAAGETV